MSKFAWVTLATNDSYSLGALVVAASLRRVATAHQITILITPGVSAAMRTKLSTVFDVIQEVNVLDSRDSANLALLARPELGVTFTKLHCWNLTQFEKCVFLDADTLVLQNCDELFEREELSAAPDVGWPDCFNSGVFVFRPSQDTFGKLLDFAVKAGSFDGGDQGLLNLYFADWAHSDISKHLPFVYNTCSTATYSYLPAFKQYGQSVKIIHFIGTSKPWLQNFDPQTRTVRTPDNYTHLASHLQTWWTIFFDQIHPHLSGDMISHAFEDIPGVENRQKETTSWYEEPQHDPPCPPPQNPPQFLPNSMVEVPNEVPGGEKHQIEFYDPWEEYEKKTEEYREVAAGVRDEIQENHYEYFEQQDVQKIPKIPNEMPQEDPQRNEERREYFHEVQESHKEAPEGKDTKEIDPGPRQRPKQQEEQWENHNQREDSPRRHSEYIPSPPREIHTETRKPPLNKDPQPDQLSAQKCPQESPKSPERQVNSISGTNGEQILGNDETGIAGALASVTLGEKRSPEQESLESQMRRQCWESGNIDYMGRDSFENILKRINQTMGTAVEEPPKEKIAEKAVEAEVKESVVAVTEEKLAPGEIVRSREDGAEERVITTVGEDGKVTTKVITTFPKYETEEEVVTEEITEGDSVTVTKTTTVTTNVTQSEIVGVPKVAAPAVTTATSTQPTPALELTKKPEPGKELVEFDETTNTTTVTRRIENGYEQIITTVQEDGTKRTQTRTFMDPEEVVDESEEIVEDPTRIIKKETSSTTETKKVSLDQQSTVVQQTTNTEATKKEIIEEEFVVTEAMTKLKTGEEIKKIDEKTKTITTIKRIENGYERTITQECEDGTSKSKTKTIFDTVAITPDTQATTANQTTQETEELVVTEAMKKLTTGQEITEVDKKTNTTTVTKRIENGYERTVTIINNDGSMRSQTKVIYDPVEVVEETKQVTPIVPAGPPTTTKTTETTTDAKTSTTVEKTQTVESSKLTNVQEQPPATPIAVDPEALRLQKEEVTKIETQEIIITEAMKKLHVGEEIVEVIEKICTTIVTKRIEKGYERVTTSILIDGTRRTHTKKTFDPVPVPKVPEAAPQPQASVAQATPQPQPQAPAAPQTQVAPVAPIAPQSQAPAAPQPQGPAALVAKPQESTTVVAADTKTTQIQSTTVEQISSKKVSTQETVQKTQNVEETSSKQVVQQSQQAPERKVETTVKSYETEEEFIPTEAMKLLKVGEELTEVDEVTKTVTVTKRTVDGYEQTITTVMGDGTKKTFMKTFYDAEEIVEETEEFEDAQEETTTTQTQADKKTSIVAPNVPTPSNVLAVCPTQQEVSIINDPNVASKKIVRHGEEEIQLEEEEEDQKDPSQKTKRAVQEVRKAKVALEESQKTEGATQTHTTTASTDAVEKKSEVITSNVGGINADVRTTSESSQSTKNTTTTSVTPSQGPGQPSRTVITTKSEKSTARKQSSSAVAATTTAGALEALAAPQAPPRKKENKKGGKGK